MHFNCKISVMWVILSI